MKGGARENRPPPGGREKHAYFEKKMLRVKCDLSKEGNMLVSWKVDGIPFSRPLLRRGTVDTYPPFPENISCLAWIMGESGDSSPGPGLDEKRKIAVISADPERFSGEILR